MGKCKHCKHWTPPAHRWSWVYTCARTRSEDGKAKDAESLAWAEDDESHCAALATAPDFGCVQFEEKT